MLKTFGKITSILSAFGLSIATASATETISYTYDELGRLIVLATSGSVNNGETVNVSVDDTSNRDSYTVTGA